MAILSAVILAKLSSSCGTQATYIAYGVTALVDAQDVASMTFTHSEDGKGDYNEVRSFKLGATRKIEMKSKGSVHTVHVVWGSASIKLRFASRESQLRWAIALQPSSERFIHHNNKQGSIPRSSTIGAPPRHLVSALPPPTIGGRARTSTVSTVASGGSSPPVLDLNMATMPSSSESYTAASFAKEHTYVDIEGLSAYDEVMTPPPLSPLSSAGVHTPIINRKVAPRCRTGKIKGETPFALDHTQSTTTMPVDEEWHQFLSASFSDIIDPPSRRPMLVSIALGRQRSGSSPAVFQREPTQ